LAGEALRALLEHVRYEVLPAAATEEKVLAHVPRDVVVTVTASPVKGLEPTLELTGRLAAHGYRVVPHVPARLLRDDVHLKEVVASWAGPSPGSASRATPRAIPSSTTT
jgi:methylenetetrahydrofolate reductase (NADH)